MKSNTQNKKIEAVTENTLVVGIDVGSEFHYARAFDWRGIEFSRKPFKFSNTEPGFKEFMTWILHIQTEHDKDAVVPGKEPTGHYWFNLGKFLQDHGMKPVLVNPHHVKKSKELDDNNPTKNDRKDPIPSQRSSELFQSITEEAKMQFFRLQGKRRVEKEYWAYDSTSISSYSETMKQVKYGKNKDGEHLPQVNLALLFGEESGLPFYYRKLAGNIPDVKTVRELIRELDVLGYEKIKLVMDRGYYSADNINALYRDHLKFLCGTSSSLKFARDYIREIAARKTVNDIPIQICYNTGTNSAGFSIV